MVLICLLAQDADARHIPNFLFTFINPICLHLLVPNYGKQTQFELDRERALNWE